MKQLAFEEVYREKWLTLETWVNALEKGKPLKDENYDEFSSCLRQICHFQALAKHRHYSSLLVDYLDHLVVRAHQQLYRRHQGFARSFIQYWVADFPSHLRAEKKVVALSSLLFILPMLLFFIWVWVKPDMMYTVMEPIQVFQMEAMYNPANRIIGEARDSQSNWHMFGFYIYNNISVAFRTFAAGLLLGVGSAFFVVFNAVLLGAVACHLFKLGMGTTFFTFVIGHGSFELTAIVLAGAAGLKLGLAIVMPGSLKRIQALTLASRSAIKIMYGVIGMLVVAAFIEAFWSSNNMFAPWQKYFVGTLLWALVLIYMLLGGRRSGTQKQP